MKIFNKPLFRPLLIIAASLLYILVAYKSSGYNNADEHYQIIEFANYKLGYSERSDLAWEFNAKIRPALQPAICYIVFKSLSFIGISDPYDLAFCLRALTGMFAIAVILFFVRSCQSVVKESNRDLLLLLSMFTWFLPYVNVRFSSESWSGLTFLITLGILFRHFELLKSKTFIWVGLILGLSILFRYQSAILAAGMIFWLFIVKKVPIKDLSILCSSILAVLLTGTVIDLWMYGEFCNTFYNYFHVNIIDNVASQYGVSPWYGMISYILYSPGPFGVFIGLAYLLLMIRKPRHILIWISLPYIIVHSIIPHKELRFLFPLVNLVPIILVLAYQELKVGTRIPKRLLHVCALLIVIINCAGIIALGFRGAGTTRISVCEYINRNYLKKDVNVIYVGDSDPYLDWTAAKNTFYKRDEIELTGISSIWGEDISTKIKPGKINLLILSPNDITGQKALDMFSNIGLHKVFQSIPEIAMLINRIYNEDINDMALLVYEFPH